ncbi:hypothetical protein vseg_003397 [Gypsophila vaccaria]
MGACCSKEGHFEGYDDRRIPVYENECEQENSVISGDYGASIRLKGFSDFVSMASLQGKKGTNQDSMTVWEDFTGEKGVYFCGVFDGHGPSGHNVAQTIRDQLPAKLSSAQNHAKTKGLNKSNADEEDDDESLNGEDDPEENSVFQTWKSCLLRAFREVDEELSLNTSIETYCSGTTSVSVIKQDDHLIISNLGDSRAVMCSRGERDQVIPVQLTVDLKPNLPREAERVRRCKGRVFALEQEPHVLRLWLPDEDSPGLAMTRAFGDFCLKDHGLISVPQVFFRRLTEQDEFVVLATDGIWDVLTNFEVVKIVLSARKRSLAAKFLAVHAIRAWKSRFPSSRTDDIAVVILFFKPPPPAKSMSDMSHITADSLSHLNSSISQYTHRSISSSDADDGFDFRDSIKVKAQDDSLDDWGEGESLVDTTLNYPRYSSARRRARSSSKDDEY